MGRAPGVPSGLIHEVFAQVGSGRLPVSYREQQRPAGGSSRSSSNAEILQDLEKSATSLPSPVLMPVRGALPFCFPISLASNSPWKAPGVEQTRCREAPNMVAGWEGKVLSYPRHLPSGTLQMMQRAVCRIKITPFYF